MKLGQRRPILTLFLIVLGLHVWFPVMALLLSLVVPGAEPVVERLARALFLPGLLWGYQWEEIMVLVGLFASVAMWTLVLLPLWLWYQSRQKAVKA